jgi:hypothetical protein
MSHDDWLERADFYALGALDAEERTQFEDHLSFGCAECDERLRQTREAVLQIPLSVSPVQTPTSDVKRRLMKQLARSSSGGSTGPTRARFRPKWARLALVASLLFLFGLSGFSVWDGWNLRKQVRDLAAEASMLRSALVQRKEVIRYMDDPEVSVTTLVGLAPSPRASGRVLWRQADRSGVIFARGLSKSAAGEKFALWAIAASGPILGGRFSDDEVRQAQFRLPASTNESDGQIREFVVTLEPSSGGARPAGAAHLRGIHEARSPNRGLQAQYRGDLIGCDAKSPIGGRPGSKRS